MKMQNFDFNAGQVPAMFSNPEFGSVRIIVKENGEPLFCLRDVAICLGYANPSASVNDVCDNGYAILIPIQDSLGRTQEAKFGPESEVYRLIFGSKLDSAKKFQDWVFKEVLPSIRKTGSYSVPQKKVPQTYIEALEETLRLAKENEALSLENKHQARELEANKPKIQMYNDLMRSDDLITIAEMAKMMDMGTKTLYKHLRRMGILSLKNLPYQRFINDGSFSVKETPIVDKSGRSRINIKILVTPKGQKLVHDHLEGAMANDMFI